MARRAPETLADYVVVGIAPALIMLLVGSLVFFLIGVFYQGEFPYRLTWVMGLFVLATVCVARISMEEGAGYAALFGLPLGVVVGIAVVYFVEIKGPLAPLSALINWSLLALIWWCAHQLTWDCTLLDDRRDTTGQGLLQSMGWETPRRIDSQQAEVSSSSNASTDPAAATDDHSDATQKEPPLWWQRWFGHREQPAAHGRWVVYFSVAALPLFGLGQFFIPADDVAGRRYAFWMLVIYVGSGLGLLLTTSFLGLRRYIRQRQLEMPVEMAATWLSVGVLMILGLLVAAALLPRPAPEYSMAAAIESRLGSFTSPDRTSSRVGFGPEGAQPNAEGQQAASSTRSSASQAGEGQGTQGQGGSSGPGGRENPQKSGESSSGAGNGTQSAPANNQGNSDAPDSADSNNSSNQGPSAAQPSKQPGSSGTTAGGSSGTGPGGTAGSESRGANRDSSNASNENSAGDSSSPGSAESGGKSGSPDRKTDPNSSPTETSQSNRTSGDSSTATSQSPSPRAPALGQALSGAGNLLRMLFYVAIGVLAAFLAWRYRHELAAAWKQLIKELGDLWNRLFGKTTSEASAEEIIQTKPVSKSFRDFADPFASGQAHRMTSAQLVQYSFDALQAWGREFATPRKNGQTAHEFSESLAVHQPAIEVPARQLAEIYSRMAYARQAPPTQTLAILNSLWQTMNDLAHWPLTADSSGRPAGSV